MNDITIVAVHPFNWFRREALKKLHVEFLDRATGFMEGNRWYDPDVDSSIVNYAKSSKILTGSYMILTPIPPVPQPMYTDPYGNVKPLLHVAAGTDLNGRVIFQPDARHMTLSVSCPQWEEHFISSAEKILDKGLDAIDIDNISNTPFIYGGDFSDWSVYKFRNYLSSRFTREELIKMGVDDIDKFDIRNYIKQRLDISRIDADILMIVAPNAEFSSEEVEAIKSYVENGGSLFLQIEPDSCCAANEISKEFGITVKCGNLVSSRYLWDHGSFEVYTINRDHDIMNGVNSLVLNWGVVLVVNNPNAIILAQTDENSWIDVNGNLLIEQNEEKGPFPVIIGLEYGKGRIIIQGDRTQDSIFDSYEVFLRNALLWLGKGVLNGKTLVFDELHREGATLSSERAYSMNAQHPEWFLYSRFSRLASRLGMRVRSTGTPPSFPEDKILREYAKFLHGELIRFISNFVKEVKEYGRRKYGKDIPVYGNQWLGTLWDDNFLLDIALDSILLSPYVDLIQIEAVPSTFPPKNRFTLLYRFGHAMAQNSKPVWNQGAFYNNLGYRELDHNKVNLTILGIAEAYANGAIKELDLAGWPGATPVAGTVMQPDTSIPKKIQSLIDFIWLNKKLLIGFKPYAKTAIIYSIPDFLHNLFPAFKIFPEQQKNELIGLADMLQWLHIPYDIVIFGHPELMDDAYYLKRLKEYDLLIFPNVKHVSHTQIQAMIDYVNSGGRIIFTGSIPSYNHDHDNLTEEDKILLTNLLQEYRNQVILIEELLGCKWYENLKEGYSKIVMYSDILNRFKSIITNMIEIPVITFNTPEMVEINIMKKGNYTAVHLINYRYNLKTDSFERIENIQFSIDKSIVGEAEKAIFISPELIRRLDLKYEDKYIKITIPFLDYWGFIVFNTSLPMISISVDKTSLTYGQTVNVNLSTFLPKDSFIIELIYTDPDGISTSRIIRTFEQQVYSDSFTPGKVGIWKVKAIVKNGENEVLFESEIISFTVNQPFPILLIIIITSIIFGGIILRKTYRKHKRIQKFQFNYNNYLSKYCIRLANYVKNLAIDSSLSYSFIKNLIYLGFYFINQAYLKFVHIPSAMS
ncbi:MAG: hypothetical protein QXX41_08650 [Nitrososphaerota archaeon]